MSLSFLVVGDASLTRHCLQMLLPHGHKIAALITDCTILTRWAQALGILVLPSQDQDQAPAADWLLSIANLRVLPASILAKAGYGAVNFHDGPLPEFAGVNAPVWALLAGQTRYAITWHLMEKTVDTGQIVQQSWFDIAEDETAFSLNSRCFVAGVESFPAVLAQLEAGTIKPVAVEDNARKGRHCFSYDRPQGLGQVDFGQPMARILQLWRALDHGAYVNPVTTLKVRIEDTLYAPKTVRLRPDLTGQPSEVLAMTAQGVVVACADGAIEFGELRELATGQAATVNLAVGQMLVSNPVSSALITTLNTSLKAERKHIKALQALACQNLPCSLQRPDAGEPVEFVAWQSAAPLAAYVLALAQILGVDHFGRQAEAIAGHTADWAVLSVNREAGFAQVQHDLAIPTYGWMLDLRLRNYGLEHLTRPLVMVAQEGPVQGCAVTLCTAGLYVAASAWDWVQGWLSRLEDLVSGLKPEGRLDPSGGAAPAVEHLTFHQQIAVQAALTPTAPAFVFMDESLSYQQLNAQANRLAHCLIADGVGPGVVVGLCLERGLWMGVAALAIVKAGGAYLPLDPEYPKERLAFYANDARLQFFVAQPSTLYLLPAHGHKLLLDDETALHLFPDTNPEDLAQADDLAYMIYTSGSTGQPKGVMVTHRNVSNFFAGMDALFAGHPPKPGAVWGAVTSLSFDISVLEMFWTTARGFKVVLLPDIRANVSRRAPNTQPSHKNDRMQFSLYYWGHEAPHEEADRSDLYHLLLEGARFADTNGFHAVWTPERHFHAFGAAYPNPAVTGAAVAAVTRNIAVRAGSCLLPLHHPLRVAEEWAVVDRLSQGRAGIAIAPGWQPEDFILRPENAPPHNRTGLFEAAEELRALWRGTAVAYPGGAGESHLVVSQPRPISAELPLWITSASQDATWTKAGEIGANVLTHLLGQNITQLAHKIGLYHQALRAAGHDPQDFAVTLMLHSYIGESREKVRALVEAPMKAYLSSAMGLMQQYAWAFPTTQPRAGAPGFDLRSLSSSERDAILDHAFTRYFNEAGLFGSLEDGRERVAQLQEIGVTEIACLVDYGLNHDQVLASLPQLSALKDAVQAEGGEQDYSFGAQMRRHQVDHLQMTPALAQLLVREPECAAALGQVSTLLLGGEALPEALARQVADLGVGRLYNMYGPTETTIWSCADLVFDQAHGLRQGRKNSIGGPLMNQQAYVLNHDLSLVMPGEVGELWLGGAGVSRGYWGRPELTAARFVPNPYGLGALYRSGDLASLSEDGSFSYHGRVDHQVKLRGHRVELGEIEAALLTQDNVTQAVVLLREDQPQDLRLVAYYCGSAPEDDLRRALARLLPPYMQPQHYVALAALPLTPNQKLDRQALPVPLYGVRAAPKANGELHAHASLKQQLAQVWARVLGVEQVEDTDSFFGLGGHSLLAVQLYRDIKTALPDLAIAVTDIFRFPVFAGFVAHLLEGGLGGAELLPSCVKVFAPSKPPSGPDLLAQRKALLLKRRGVAS